MANLKCNKWLTSSVVTLLCCLLIFLFLWIANYAFPLAIPDKHRDFATVVLDDDGVPLRAFSDKNGVWRYQVSLQDVSPDYLEALINYEDRYFYQHPGVNPVSFLRAAWQYLYHQRIVSGGSTLTMQVARLLHPHDRSLSGKLQQVLRALQLEWQLSKAQILTLYINYAPFGGTLEGVQAASYQYFRKLVSDIRPAEAVLLAVLPQAPSRYRPDRHPKRATQARNKVISRLASQDIWSEQKASQVKQEPVVVWEPEQPFVAPLLARRLQQKNSDKSVIKTYIQRDLQQQISAFVADYASLQGEAVSMAVLVVDNATQRVISYVGSASMQDESRAGHVDMIQAIRSPGSTLKPLLFGLAIDANIIHSHSLLADVPRLSSRYRPGNFAQGFDGPVTATEALQRSLNIPFVQLIEAYGEQTFVNKLAHVLHPLRIPGNKANAAIILGGAGISLEGLVALHSSLVNEGVVKALLFENNEHEPLNKSVAPRRLMSKEAAWITWKTLTGGALPKHFNWGVSKEQRSQLAWKTGTSWGSRDTWAIGSTKQHTIGVWVGKPNGDPMREALGVTTAAPALFSVSDMLNDKRQQPIRPYDVEDKAICWPDGRSENLVNGNCDRRFIALTKAGVAPRTLQIETGSAFHQALQTFMVDPKTSLRLTAECGALTAKMKKVTLWPRRFEPWLKADEKRSARIPNYSKRCLVIPKQADALTIVGIENRQQLYRQQSEPIQKTVLASGKFGKVSWYLNGRWISTQSQPLQLTLPKTLTGNAELIAVDEHGVTGRVHFFLKDSF
ncbi:penicillin-binding protein 1C [Psychromonas sp. psych-6C06]|uniref:penicillin-binding protein 1C n=1 Tax=Psychromonas sp. psych-6C06 TaxID=2058089 RepID=UPI000C343C3D|nr:penicillin-binding protein 1C [Psychromonas sp. psych-6C06]PKF63541.1 penicillin-binding protein 1C [Psychromonas sp. psych-6C06]